MSVPSRLFVAETTPFSLLPWEFSFCVFPFHTKTTNIILKIYALRIVNHFSCFSCPFKNLTRNTRFVFITLIMFLLIQSTFNNSTCLDNFPLFILLDWILFWYSETPYSVTVDLIIRVAHFLLFFHVFYITEITYSQFYFYVSEKDFNSTEIIAQKVEEIISCKK